MTAAVPTPWCGKKKSCCMLGGKCKGDGKRIPHFPPEPRLAHKDGTSKSLANINRAYMSFSRTRFKHDEFIRRSVCNVKDLPKEATICEDHEMVEVSKTFPVDQATGFDDNGSLIWCQQESQCSFLLPSDPTAASLTDVATGSESREFATHSSNATLPPVWTSDNPVWDRGNRKVATCMMYG